MLAARQVPCKLNFTLPPCGPKYSCLRLVDPSTAGQPVRRRLPERICCPSAVCLPAARCATGAAQPTSPARKRKKDSDLVRATPAVRTSTPSAKNALVVGPCVALVHLADTVFVYDLQQRRSTEPVGSLECLAAVTALAFNHHTACGDSVELAVGFATGDLLVWDAVANAITFRANKDKAIDPSAVVSLTWVPSVATELVVAHEGGGFYVYDTRLSDEAALPLPLVCGAVANSPKSSCNPVQRVAVANKSITALEFSPSRRLLALSSLDGNCYVLLWEDRRPLLKVQSYFGAVLCACWSPDEQFLAFGGEDDTISVVDVAAAAVVARCVGHRCWVSAIQFDPTQSVTDDSGVTRYRIVSASHDTQVAFWDFEAERTNSRGIEALLETAGSAGLRLVRSQSAAANVEPFTMQQLHADCMCGLTAVSNGSLVTVCACAIGKLWAPAPVAPPGEDASIVVEV